MKLKQTIRLLLLLAVCMICLCGCHGGKRKNAFTVPTEFDTSKDITISFWAKNDTNQTQTDIYKKAIAEFEALYPNIHVTMKTYTDYAAIYQDVITNISTDTTPNVCITYPDHIATYMQGNNVVVNLDSLMADPYFGLGGSEIRFDGPKQSEIVEKFLNECKIGGSCYALPYMRSTEALYVNKTLLNAAGYELPETVTWDFIWEVSEAALAKNADGTYKVNGQTTLIPFIYKSTDNMMISMLAQLGADYTDASGRILMFNDTTRDLLKEISVHGKSKAFSTFKISSYPGNFLNANQCIFAIDSTAGATWMGYNAPNLDICSDDVREFEIAVTEIPQFDPAHPKMISQGPSVCIFNKSDSDVVMASWLFMQYLLTNDVQIAYSQTEGYIPVTTKAHADPVYVDYLANEGADNSLHYPVKIQAAKLFLKNIDNTFVTPVFAGSASVRDAAGEMIENVTKAVRRKKTVDDSYIKSMYDEVAALKHLDQIVISEPIDSENGENGAVSTSGLNRDLGKLPSSSVVLLVSLVAVWAVLIALFLLGKFKKRQ